jgi:hypothetical protein
MRSHPAMSDRLAPNSPVRFVLAPPFGAPKGPPLPPVYLKSHHQKLLDDPGRLLYCDREFDRQGERFVGHPLATPNTNNEEGQPGASAQNLARDPRTKRKDC